MKNENVMTPGMRIAATNGVGTIVITAIDELTRSYTWEGATRSVEMLPREQRWYGSLGLYYPGPGDHWEEHNGITRGVLEEGQQHFKSVQAALDWMRPQTWMDFVYRDDGLVVGWGKELSRRQLNVEVWQIYVDGKKPHKLPGSQNSKVIVSYVQTETSPLVLAVQHNEAGAIQTLLSKGADPNVKNSVGTPVLVMAARHGYANIASSLLAKGADTEARNEEGATALLIAVESDHPDVVAILLSKGANVNAAYQNGIEIGMTALIAAATTGNTSMVKLLLKHGADVNIKAEAGFTALQMVEAENHPEIVRLLKQAGAKQ